MSTTSQDPHGTEASEREIQEDVMNVPLVSWLGAVTAILVAVTVLLLTALYHYTKNEQRKERQAEADRRLPELKAQRMLSAQIVDGYFKEADQEVETEGGAQLVRGKVTIPVEIGMRQVVEQHGH